MLLAFQTLVWLFCRLTQQAMEMHKRKAVESSQTAADLKLHLDKYQAQLKEAQVSVAEKTGALEQESFKYKRMQVYLLYQQCNVLVLMYMYIFDPNFWYDRPWYSKKLEVMIEVCDNDWHYSMMYLGKWWVTFVFFLKYYNNCFTLAIVM